MLVSTFKFGPSIVMVSSQNMDSTSVSLLRRLSDPTEETAWERFVELYTPMMFYWARRRGIGVADATDLVQDVLLTLIQRIRDYDPKAPGRFRGWLRTVTVNRVTDFQRRRSHQALTGADSQLRTLVDDSHDSPWQEHEYRRHLIVKALQMLQDSFEPTTWQAAYSQIIEGAQASSVAAEFDISINAAYVAKSRVLDRLRSELEGLLE